MKSGFVNIFGKPNAGKSTLLNSILQEKLAIVSSKVQTTRNRIKGFLTKPEEYQMIFSDTPGIIDPKYKLHEKMMANVKSALEDADVALLMVDVNDDLETNDALFSSLKLKVPSILIINKIDKVSAEKVEEVIAFFQNKNYAKAVIPVSAQDHDNIDELITLIAHFLPEGFPFYEEDEMTDLPTKFFVGEMIREKVYELFSEEIPYQTAVVVNQFKEKDTLTKIQADIIVQRESQKAILLGKGGQMIKKIGTLSRGDIEKFLDRKVFLELFIKVRPKWRDSDQQLKEYGYL